MLKNKEIKSQDIKIFSKKLKIPTSFIETLIDDPKDQELFLSSIACKLNSKTLNNLSFKCALKIFIYQTLSKYQIEEKNKISISENIINKLFFNIQNKQRLGPTILYKKDIDAAFSNIVSCGLIGLDYGTPHLYTIYFGLDKILTIEEISNWMLSLNLFSQRINDFLLESLKKQV